jgi:hypothetical protein
MMMIGGCNMNNENTELNSNRALQVLADAYAAQMAGQLSKARALESANTLEQCVMSLPPELRLPLQYHQARLLVIGDERDQALKVLDDLDSASAIFPEGIWLKIQLAASEASDQTNQMRWTLEDQLGTLLPLSAWGRLLDSRLEQREADKEGHPLSDSPLRPTIPILDAEKLMRIASLYDQMAMNVEAAGAFREAIYSAFAPPGLPEAGADTWMSDTLANVWLTIARYEISLGIKRWAAQAVFMGVACSPRVRAAAAALLRDIESGKKPFVQPKPNADILFEIAGLYRACNLHLRAVQALDRAAEFPGVNVSSLRNEIVSEWSKRISLYASGRNQICFLFGLKTSSVPPEKLLSSQFPYGER